MRHVPREEAVPASARSRGMPTTGPHGAQPVFERLASAAVSPVLLWVVVLLGILSELTGVPVPRWRVPSPTTRS